MIKIEWLSDEHNCDICGFTTANGAVITIDDVEAFRLEPQAHCYDSVDYPEEYVFMLIIKHLGHDVEINYV